MQNLPKSNAICIMGDLKTMQVSLDLYIRLVIYMLSLLTEHHYLSLCHQIRRNLFERQIYLPMGIDIIYTHR